MRIFPLFGEVILTKCCLLWGFGGKIPALTWGATPAEWGPALLQVPEDQVQVSLPAVLCHRLSSWPGRPTNPTSENWGPWRGWTRVHLQRYKGREGGILFASATVCPDPSVPWSPEIKKSRKKKFSEANKMNPSLKGSKCLNVQYLYFITSGEAVSHKRAMKLKAREERRKERELRRREKHKQKSATTKVAELGPLGSILKAIIQANTWTWKIWPVWSNWYFIAIK